VDLPFKPYSEKHAIKQVLFVLEFQTPLTSEALEAFKASPAHEALRAELPRFQEGKGVVLAPDSPAVINFPQDGQLFHITYDKLLPNGDPEWAINIRREMVGVACGKYARWAPTWEFARGLLKQALPVLLKHTRVGVVGLQVVDEFHSTGSKEDFALRSLFVEQSKLLPANLVGLRTSCHAHHGFFEQAQDPPGRRLHNINVDVVERPKDFTVQILSSHKHYLGETQEEDDPLGDKGALELVYSDLHKMNKMMVGDMLTDDIKSAISFDGQQQGKA
jgi:uncharacterized protein (TIGR04255 family)